MNSISFVPKDQYSQLHVAPMTAPFDFDKTEQEPVVIEEEVIDTAWKNVQANWWKIHNDEEADDADVKEAKKRMPIGKREYIALLTTIISSLGLQVIFRDEPIMKGTSGASINAIKISYNQMQPGTTAKYVMRALAIATFIAGVTLHFVPEDPHGVVRIMRAAPLTDMFMTVFLKCDLNKAKLDKMLCTAVKKCTGKDVPKRLAKAITKGFFALAGGALMNIPQYVGPFVATGSAVLAKANMRGVVDTLWQGMEKIENPALQKVALAAAYSSFAAVAGISAYALTLPAVRQNALTWLPAAALVIAGDTLARTVKTAVKSYEVPEEYAPPRETPTFWNRCGTVLKGLGLVAATVGMSYVVGPSTLPTAAGASVTTNAGILTTVCQEMSSFLKIAAGKLVPSQVAFFGSLTMLGAGAGYHLAEGILNATGLVTPVQRATAAAFLAAVLGVATYEAKDYLRAPKKPKQKPIELEEIVTN